MTILRQAIEKGKVQQLTLNAEQFARIMRKLGEGEKNHGKTEQVGSGSGFTTKGRFQQ